MNKTWFKLKSIFILILLTITIVSGAGCYSDSNIIVTPTKALVSKSQSLYESIEESSYSSSISVSSVESSRIASSKVKATISPKASPANSPTEDPLEPKTKVNDSTRDSMNIKYGVEILYGDDVYWDYEDVSMTSLRDTTYISLGLTLLDNELGRYPIGFFSEFNRKLRIFLITSFTENYSGMAVYNNEKYYELYLTASEYSIPTIHHELMHMIDFSLNDTTGTNPFPEWLGYNPQGFTYTNNNSSGTPYLYSINTASTNWFFVSNYSIKNELEDRAEIFSKLMTTSKSMPYFSGSSPLAQKIDYLTSIINKSFKSINSETSPAWEKYLA